MKVATINVHTPYLYSLLRISHEIYCLVNLPSGQPWRPWESRIRPKPENYREVGYNNNFKAEDYDLLILQTPEHLMSPLAHADIPKIFIQHNPPDFPPPCYHPVRNPDITVVFVSQYVRRRWYLVEEVKGVAIETGIPAEFYSWKGLERQVLTVVRSFVERAHVTGYNLWRTLTRDVPSKVVDTPINDLTSGLGFDELRKEYSTNRVYLNTAIAPCMTMREAMMTGMPVVTRTEDIPFENEVEIFKSTNPKKLREYIELCLNYYEVARQVGEAGRRKAVELFNINLFVEKWEELLEEVVKGG